MAALKFRQDRSMRPSDGEANRFSSILSLARMLGRIGIELESTAEKVGRLQIDLEDLPRELDCHSPLWASMQDLDLVEQTLRALATVLARLAVDDVDPASSALETLVAELPLTALASRLRGLSGHHDDAELELF